MKFLAIGLSVLLLQSGARAELSEIKLTQQKATASRNVIEAKYGKGVKSLTPLEQIRLAIWNQDYSKCLSLIVKNRTRNTAIAPWVAIVEIECYLGSGALSADAAKRLGLALSKIESQRDWFLLGAYSEPLKRKVIEAKFAMVTAQMKRSPQEAWAQAEDMLKYTEWMTGEQKAEAFKLAGESSFVRQKLTAAKRYIERSLELKEDEKLRVRLQSIESVLKTGGLEGVKATAELSQRREEKLEASEKENSLFERMKTALRSGDIVAAVEDGLDLMEDYPWGRRAEWVADRIWESYSNIVSKTDKNYVLLKARILKQMLRADAKRLYDWANGAFRYGQYSDAFELAEQAIKKQKDVVPSTQLHLLAARSAQSSGQDSEAKRYYSQLIERHAGTSEARTALLQYGLLSYRSKEFTAAVASFERLLVLPETENMELETRYWLWRSLQNVDNGRAKVEADELIRLYPFSYYGLRARAETTNGSVDLADFKPQQGLKSSLWVTPTEKKAWERALILIQGGWWEQAQAELETIPHPKDPVARAYLAQVWVAAFGYPRAIRLFNEAWDADRRLRGQPFLGSAFPKEFSNLIEREAKKNNLDSNWVRSLIRQESAFNITARSRSGALGLMQMIPPTAEEVASDLKIKELKLPQDLWDPEKNLIFCTYYLSKVLSQFSGHLPLALASYNAGPTRIKKWIEARRIEITTSSEPLNELWIDELPWSEPKFYVKAIMRNLILYRSLDKGRVALTNPIWALEQREPASTKNKTKK